MPTNQVFMKKKFKKIIRIYRNEGLLSFVREVWSFAIKPLRLLREEIIWIFLTIQTKKKPLTTIINGHKMYLNHRDKGISKELAIYSIHEPLTTRVIKKIITRGMTVIDLGANIGYYTLIESKLVGSEGKIVAVEPNSENIKFLKLNIQKNGIKNVTVIEAAIGDRDGFDTLHLSETSNWHSMISNPSLKQLNSVEVKVRQLDNLIEELGVSVSLIRMDIEGYEINVIRGMIRTLQKYGPRLVVELHPQLVGSQAICNLLITLKTLGYVATHIIERERDHPYLENNRAIEISSIDSLLNDERLINEQRSFMVFFQKQTAGKNL
jgi:FkbM family methyltransferase